MSYLVKQRLKILTICSALLLAACENVPVVMLSKQAGSYFQVPAALGIELESLGNGLYAYKHDLGRSLVIDYESGLVVIESYDKHVAKDLKQKLLEKFPGKPVTHLIYSHHHLDHTRGGHALKPESVVAHENTRWHFEQYKPGEVLMPTRYIKGDQVLSFGNREVTLLDFNNGHARHLYGFYFPDDKLLYAPDLAFCNTVPPFGYPDFNHYGHVQALDRASKLDFTRFISSHFDNGDVSCVTGTLDLFSDSRNAVLEAFEIHGLPSDPGNGDAKWFRSVVYHVQGKLKPRYGDWHGYEEMLLPFIFRQISGGYLGF